MSDGVVIAGGGLAAQRCCETLRSRGYDGAIRMVCAEPIPPYDRPPLSKELLAGSATAASIALRPWSWYDENAVELVLGTRAIGLDMATRTLELAASRPLRYDSLLIATGAEPRTLAPLDGYQNVTALRTLADARELAHVLRPGTRLAIVGAGFIGLEVAATARGLGTRVTLIEALAAPLAGLLGKPLGAWFAQLHRSEEVDVLLDARVARVRGRRRVRELELEDGRRLGCDHVVVGVGVRPATAWLAGSGLDADGVRVDADGRTGAAGVYAAGDACRPYEPVLARHVRSEHWEAAARQGAAAARAMLGLVQRPSPPASFWSDQYGVRVQYVGHAAEAERIAIDGDPDSREFSAEFTRGGATVAALLVGRPHELAAARRRVQDGLDGLTATETRSRT